MQVRHLPPATCWRTTHISIASWVDSSHILLESVSESNFLVSNFRHPMTTGQSRLQPDHQRTTQRVERYITTRETSTRIRDNLRYQEGCEHSRYTVDARGVGGGRDVPIRYFCLEPPDIGYGQLVFSREGFQVELVALKVVTGRNKRHSSIIMMITSSTLEYKERIPSVEDIHSRAHGIQPKQL